VRRTWPGPAGSASAGNPEAAKRFDEQAEQAEKYGSSIQKYLMVGKT
jgi:hypothetical protein